MTELSCNSSYISEPGEKYYLVICIPDEGELYCPVVHDEIISWPPILANTTTSQYCIGHLLQSFHMYKIMFQSYWESGRTIKFWSVSFLICFCTSLFLCIEVCMIWVIYWSLYCVGICVYVYSNWSILLQGLSIP